MPAILEGELHVVELARPLQQRQMAVDVGTDCLLPEAPTHLIQGDDGVRALVGICADHDHANNLLRMCGQRLPAGPRRARLNRADRRLLSSHARDPRVPAGPHIGDKPPTPSSGAGAAKKRANPAEPAKHHIDAKKLEAAKSISLARFSSRTSASSCLIFCASPLVVPGRFPASMSACLHQPRKVSAFTPTREPIRCTAWCIDSPGSSSRASCTSRIALSRNSGGYFLGAGMILILSGIRPSIRPGAVQCHHTSQ